MKKCFLSLLVVAVAVMMLAPTVAQAKGGVGPCIVSCCIGPRVALEMNEGKPIETLEIIGLFFGIVKGIPGLQAAGVKGCCAGMCFGPRVGAQLNERKVRTSEILRLVIIGGVLNAMEAFKGTTMTEVEQAEGLRK